MMMLRRELSTRKQQEAAGRQDEGGAAGGRVHPAQRPQAATAPDGRSVSVRACVPVCQQHTVVLRKRVHEQARRASQARRRRHGTGAVRAGRTRGWRRLFSCRMAGGRTGGGGGGCIQREAEAANADARAGATGWRGGGGAGHRPRVAGWPAVRSAAAAGSAPASWLVGGCPSADGRMWCVCAGMEGDARTRRRRRRKAEGVALVARWQAAAPHHHRRHRRR